MAETETEVEIRQDLSVPVIAIDGGAGVGKGATRRILAKNLGFHSLDSGVLYRALGLICHRKGILSVDSNDSGTSTFSVRSVAEVVSEVKGLDIRVDSDKVMLDGRDETKAIRGDMVGKLARAISPIAEVRKALVGTQLSMRRSPGLIADGRDQGLIFDTPYRYFLTCDAGVRARRRVKEFENLGLPGDFKEILKEIRERDLADETREVRPLEPHPRALTIDTSNLTADEVANLIVCDYRLNR